MLILALNQDIS